MFTLAHGPRTYSDGESSPHTSMRIPYSPETPVGVYSASATNPETYVSIEQARAMRKSGEYYSINCGKDIRKAGQVEQTIPEELQKTKWVARSSGCRVLGIAPVNVLQLI